jgi:flagellar biosynthesis protein FlhF
MSQTPSLSEPRCYKFTVDSAEQAASVIRERLGPKARVLSVRSIEATGLKRIWATPQLEVVASVMPEDDPTPAEVPAENQDGAPIEAFPRPAAPKAPTLASLLRCSGVSDIAIGRLQCDPAWPEFESLPLHRALVEVGFLLKRQGGGWPRQLPLKRAAFLGTSGSGRTTSLCKCLGIEVIRNRRSGRVFVVEFDRPNPTGPLPMFCEALNLPFGRFPAYFESLEPEGFTYFDMPAISLRNPEENSAIAEFLDREGIEQRVLVLNVAYDQATLRSAYAAGCALGATHLIFTHLDEVQQWGRVWDYLCDGALNPLFLATGPALTGDCDEDVWGAVVHRTLAASNISGEADDGSMFAPRLRGAHA